MAGTIIATEVLDIQQETVEILKIIGQRRRVEYGDNLNAGNSINGEESLVVLDQALVIIGSQCSLE